MNAIRRCALVGCITLGLLAPSIAAEPPAAPSLIVHHGKIITVDKDFSTAAAMAVGEDGRIVAVGGSDEITKLAGPSTRVIDLAGKTVLPGLIDSHVHPAGASMTEFDHPVPTMESIADVLSYVRDRAKALGPDKWVVVSQVFITRLKEQRYPSRAELDDAAPKNPVIFATGPDASVNSLALKSNKIDKDYKPPAGSRGFVEHDPQSGEPTGVLRGYEHFFNAGDSPSRKATDADRNQRLVELFHDYNAHGITAIGERATDSGSLNQFKALREAKTLTVRISCSRTIDSRGASNEDIQRQVDQIAQSDLHAKHDPMLETIGIKVFLDGGMLTGSAYMSKPWGVSKIYGISDPKYQGVLLIPPGRLGPIVRACGKARLQFTAHTVGDGAVDVLLDAYEAASKSPEGLCPRPCITHCNFIRPDEIERMKKLGVSADIQPIWLWSDARTLRDQFGDERLSIFQPLNDLFAAGVVIGGGSDHMQKIGADRAINRYDPFMGMWITLQRDARWQETPLHPEHRLTREQAVRMYTANNAWLLFRENDIGSLEKGKLADFIIVDRDVMSCPVDGVRDTQVIETFLGGKSVFHH